MKIMKKVIFVLGSALLVMFTACTKNDNSGIQLQAHEKPYDGQYACHDG